MDNCKAKLKLFIAMGFYEKAKPGCKDLKSFESGFKKATHALKNHRQFISGILSKNLEEDGKYAYFNYTVFDTYDQQGTFLHDGCWTDVVLEGQGREVINHQAGFAEKRVIANVNCHIKPLPKTPLTDTTAYMVVCSQVEESILDRCDIERSWKIWSGLECVRRQRMCGELGLRSVILHRRITTNGKFKYVSRYEFTKLGDKIQRGFELLRHIRELRPVKGISSYVALYTPIYVYNTCT
ncbi:uncharacterized protein LOC144437589 [Glandiceps talaboti]